MVKRAKEIGLDCVKFQMHDTFFESTISEQFRVSVFPQDISRSAYWNRTSFTSKEWEYIYEYCNSINIDFLCTPFSVNAAKLLKDLGCKSVKIASGDFDNDELLEFCGKEFETIYLSTGFACMEEIELRSEYFQLHFQRQPIFLQCTSKYPTPLEEVGLIFFDWYSENNLNYGLSDHTGNPHVIMSAIALHAQMVEFHVVFSKYQFGPDSGSSLTFEQAKEIVEFRSTFEQITLHSYSKNQVSSDLKSVKEIFERGLSLKASKKKGEVIHLADLTLKKPKGPFGWENRDLFIGKKLSCDVSSNQHLDIDCIEN
jgi:N-acetylneuraminate synthase